MGQAKKDPSEVLPVDKQKEQEERQQGDSSVLHNVRGDYMRRLYASIYPSIYPFIRLIYLESRSFTHHCFSAVQYLRTLLTLIASNSEVRKLLSDFSLIGRDLLARSAAYAAESIRPDVEALNNVDRPVPQDQFETKGDGKTGSNETPVAGISVLGTDATVRHDPFGDTEIEKGGDTMQGGEVSDKARVTAHDTKEKARGTGQELARNWWTKPDSQWIYMPITACPMY